MVGSSRKIICGFPLNGLPIDSDDDRIETFLLFVRRNWDADVGAIYQMTMDVHDKSWCFSDSSLVCIPLIQISIFDFFSVLNIEYGIIMVT